MFFALAHLALVSAGAFGVDYSSDNILGRMLNGYGSASGAGSSYGFFAPGIFSQIRAVFDITGRDGSVRSIPLESHVSHEADLRIGNIIEQFANDFDNQIEFQRSLAASLAATFFGREPQAKSINVRIERFTPSSMEEHRLGLRPLWIPEYSAKFVHNLPVAKQ